MGGRRVFGRELERDMSEGDIFCFFCRGRPESPSSFLEASAREEEEVPVLLFLGATNVDIFLGATKMDMCQFLSG